MITTSWYRVGKCNRCGKCCDVMTFYNDRGAEGDDERRYAQSHKLPWRPSPDGIGMTAPIYAQCVHHISMPDGKMGCELHGTPEQPHLCRVWPVGPDDFYKKVDAFWGCSVRLLWVDDSYLEAAAMPEVLG